MNIKKLITSLGIGATLLALTATSAFAADITTKNDCLTAGGTWTNVNGVKSCTTAGTPFTTTDPNPPRFTASGTVATTESQKGAIGAPGTTDTHNISSVTTVTDCTNPQGHSVSTTNPNCSGWY